MFYSPGLCASELGVESGNIINEQMRASSYLPDRNPEFARIRFWKSPDLKNLSWSPKESDSDPYLEVSFFEPTEITALSTQGGEDGNFVRRFTIQYDDNEGVKTINENVVEDDGMITQRPLVFAGNKKQPLFFVA